MTLVVEFDWDEALRSLAPLFDELDNQIEQWFDERRRGADKQPFHDLLVLLEDFPELFASMEWLVWSTRPKPWHCLPPVLFPPVVALAGTAVAARSVAPRGGFDWTVPLEVRRQFLDMWVKVGDRRQDGVTVPQVVAAYLSGGWSPQSVPRCSCRWEPAGLLVQAMTWKMVQHGVHTMQLTGLPPWAKMNPEERAERTLAGSQKIVLWLTGVQKPSAHGVSTLVRWDWEQLTLWEFLCGAILGPARAGSTGRARPQAAAFGSTLFGVFVKATVGTTGGTIELFVCTECRSLSDHPVCSDHSGTVTIATPRKHRFVAPRDHLSTALEAGHVQVERKVCKNEQCTAVLHALVNWTYAQPIYRVELDSCPYCQSHLVGQRYITVWTKAG